MYLTRTAGIETYPAASCRPRGGVCILPALRELKPGRGGSDIRFIGMYLTRTAGIETAGFSTDKRAGNMYLTRTAGIETLWLQA